MNDGKFDKYENKYSYHETTDDQNRRSEAVRDKAREIAVLLDKVCPPSRELSLAHTKLEEAVMWANKSIAINK